MKNVRVPVCLQCVFVMAAAVLLAFPTVAATQTLPDEVVLWTSAVAAGDIHGDWARLPDPLAAGGLALHNPDRGRAKISPALASPANYFEIRFYAKRATAYQLWVRMRAENNSYTNDAIHVQFSDSVDSNGAAVTRIGTSDSAGVILQDGGGGSQPSGWGWADNSWTSTGTPIFFAADGTHVIRIQQRDDGAIVDQIVLSARTYASTPPGPRQQDTTILPAVGSAGSTAPSSATIVIRPATAAAGRMYGNWHTISDATAAGGQAVRNPDAGAAKIDPPLTNPASYFEASFTASAGRAYHLWLRLRADGDSVANDSVHVQFNGSVTSTGSPFARIGTTDSLDVILQDGSGAAAPRGWGWADNDWGVFGRHIYFVASGTQTIRVQQREDGPAIDQIVISPDTYLTTPPGTLRDDRTIVPLTGTTTPANVPPTVVLTAPAAGSTFTAPATITLSATASDPENRLSKVDFYNGVTLLGSDASAPFSFLWSNIAAGTYQLKAVATDADGGTASSAIASVTVQGVSANQPPTVTLTAPSNGATFTAPATMTLTATASDPEGRLTKVDFYNGSALLGSDTTAPYSYSWGSVAAGSYSMRAVASDADGGSATSATASVTVTSASTLPNGQLNQDVGGPAIAGSVQYSNGTYTVRAAGVDIWGTSDQFHFVYRQVTGDVQITARVASLQAVDPWSKAGVMIRETLTGGSRHAFAHPTPANGYKLTRRFNTGDVSSSTSTTSGSPPPGWVRLVRRGNTFEMYRSGDGVTWTLHDSVQITMAANVFVGIAVTSHNASTATTAVLDNLSVTTPATANQPPTVTLTAPANGSTLTAPATITLSATASDPENRLSKVDFYNGSTLLGSDTSAPFSFTWQSVAAGTYQLKAVASDADGGSASSAIASITVGTATTSTKRVAFTASVDHATVTNYLLEVFPSTANPATATASTSSDLGKPTPSSTNEIIVDRTTFLNNLAPGTYWITVAAVSSGGKSRSTAISFTR